MCAFACDSGYCYYCIVMCWCDITLCNQLDHAAFSDMHMWVFEVIVYVANQTGIDSQYCDGNRIWDELWGWFLRSLPRNQACVSCRCHGNCSVQKHEEFYTQCSVQLNVSPVVQLPIVVQCDDIPRTVYA